MAPSAEGQPDHPPHVYTYKHGYTPDSTIAVTKNSPDRFSHTPSYPIITVALMSLLTVESHINIKKSPSAVFAFISSPSNWAGLHPGSKEIRGEGVTSSAAVGTRFIEVINDENGNAFDAAWVVTRSIKDEFFQFQFPSDFTHGPFHEIVVTYNVTLEADGSTAFTRRMVSWVRPGAGGENLRSFSENAMHNRYVANVKAKVEGL